MVIVICSDRKLLWRDSYKGICPVSTSLYCKRLLSFFIIISHSYLILVTADCYYHDWGCLVDFFAIQGWNISGIDIWRGLNQQPYMMVLSQVLVTPRRCNNCLLGDCHSFLVCVFLKYALRICSWKSQWDLLLKQTRVKGCLEGAFLKIHSLFYFTNG